MSKQLYTMMVSNGPAGLTQYGNSKYLCGEKYDSQYLYGENIKILYILYRSVPYYYY